MGVNHHKRSDRTRRFPGPAKPAPGELQIKYTIPDIFEGIEVSNSPTPAVLANKSPQKPPRRTGNSIRVLDFFQSHRNMEFSYETIARELHLPRTAVVSSVEYLADRKGYPIKRVMKGRAIYNDTPKPAEAAPNPEPNRRVYSDEFFERIGNSAGIDIVRGEDGTLYRLLPLFGGTDSR